ncbi:hypothetical protein VDGD_20374 [Verticillium dahliae]|nr:hypothetical protein VDGD_20374 [Verticillium dahliae]
MLMLGVFAADLYGNAQFASGQSTEDTPLQVGSQAEGWSFIQKGLLFGVVLAVVAIYFRMNKKDDSFHEKSLA